MKNEAVSFAKITRASVVMKAISYPSHEIRETRIAQELRFDRRRPVEMSWGTNYLLLAITCIQLTKASLRG